MPETLMVQPYDVHNQLLVSNVHPPDWANPEPAGRYNLVVLGAGTAGLISAAGAAGLGGRVALVERAFLGGDCLNVGCVPSKALIRASRAAAEVRDAHDTGVDVPAGVRVNFPAVMERMRRLRAALSPNDSAARFRGLGVDVFFGAARFTGPCGSRMVSAISRCWAWNCSRRGPATSLAKARTASSFPGSTGNAPLNVAIRYPLFVNADSWSSLLTEPDTPRMTGPTSKTASWRGFSRTPRATSSGASTAR